MVETDRAWRGLRRCVVPRLRRIEHRVKQCRTLSHVFEAEHVVLGIPSQGLFKSKGRGLDNSEGYTVPQLSMPCVNNMMGPLRIYLDRSGAPCTASNLQRSHQGPAQKRFSAALLAPTLEHLQHLVDASSLLCCSTGRPQLPLGALGLCAGERRACSCRA